MPSTFTPPPLLRAMRPHQWSKNLLVVAAPLAAGALLDSWLPVLLAFVAFVAVSSATYLVNDVRDVAFDRLHPRKRHRPVAAGQVSPTRAITAATLLASGGLALAFAVDLGLGATVGVYLVLQAGYVLGLKQQPVLDLAVVATGFLLRAIAGAAAGALPVSPWFLLVAAFGSLFVVAGKRYSELRELGSSGQTRSTLTTYSESYLRFVWGLAATVTVVVYALWAVEIADGGPVSWQAVSIAPFVLALLRYAVDIDRGLAGEPEEAIARDPVLLVLALAWIVSFALGAGSE